MENAANALKIAFGIFVFIVGLAVVFNMTSQAREVSRVLISETDRTNSYLHYDESQYTQKVDPNTGNRIVTMDEIIPVLYRYAEENYAVTIVDTDKNIIARFDRETESMCRGWDNTTTASKQNKYKFVGDLYKNVFNNNKIKSLNIKWPKITDYNPDDPDPKEIDSTTDREMKKLFEKWYCKENSNPTGIKTVTYGCDWLR